jgi:hypothetical protein
MFDFPRCFPAGSEAVRLVGFTVEEAEADPARLVAWRSQHSTGLGDFGVRVVVAGGATREYHVIATWSKGLSPTSDS